MRLHVYTSNKAVSLHRVAGDVVTVLSRHIESLDAKTFFEPVVDARRISEADACMVVMQFDPIWAVSYYYVAREYAVNGRDVLVYTEIPGEPNKPSLAYWLIRDLEYVVNSNYSRRKLEKIGAKIRDVVYHGVDTKRVASAAKLADSWRRRLRVDDKILIGYVAQGLRRKLHDKFAEVVRAVRNKTSEIEFVILTDNRARDYYSGTGAIVLEQFGKLPLEQLFALYSACDLYAQASGAESFCIPVLEALAAGKVVVHPDYEPLSEITDESCSVRVPVTSIELERGDGGGVNWEMHYYDVVEFADCIHYAVDLIKKEKDELATRAIARAKKFDMFKTYRKLVKFLC